MFLLETSFLIDLAREKHGSKGPAFGVLEGVADSVEVHVSTITLAQLAVGEYLAPSARTRRRNRQFGLWIQAVCNVIPFGAAHADVFGKVVAVLGRAGTPIPESDAQIAAVAIWHGLTLITRDREHFRRVKGLKVLTY